MKSHFLPSHSESMMDLEDKSGICFGEFRVTHTKKPKWDKHGESYTQTLLLEVFADEGTTPEEIDHAVYRAAGRHCYCEHDCCGHIQSSIHKMRQVKPGIWLAIEHGVRNI